MPIFETAFNSSSSQLYCACTVRAAAEQCEHDFSSFKGLGLFRFHADYKKRTNERTSDADEEEGGDDEGVFFFFFFPRSLPFYNARQYTKADDA